MLPPKLPSLAYTAITEYGDAEAMRLPAATLHTALPLPLTAGVFVQDALLESLPVIVNVTAPVALSTGPEPVLDGLITAVNVAAWPVVTLAGPVTTVLVATGSALARNELRATVPTVATAPAPATIGNFPQSTSYHRPPQRLTPASHRRSAECVRDKRRRCHDRLCRVTPTGGPTGCQIFAVDRPRQIVSQAFIWHRAPRMRHQVVPSLSAAVSMPLWR